jgi:tight adherence protein C
VALVGATAALIGRAVALPRMQARDRLGNLAAYGFADSGDADPGGGALGGVIDRVARTIGRVAAGRVKGLSEAEMRRELMAAGMYRLSPVTLIGYRVICAICVPATFVWLASAGGLGGPLVVIGALFMLGIGWIGPMRVIRRRAERRLSQIDYELPELVDLLVLTVEAGMGFVGAMHVAAERFSGPLGDEVRLALQEQAMGLPTDQALANMLGRADSDSMRSFVRSIRQGEALGVSIGQILRNLSGDMRDRRRSMAEERAQKAPIKILFPLVALIFPSIFVVLLAPAALNFLVTMGNT